MFLDESIGAKDPGEAATEATSMILPRRESIWAVGGEGGWVSCHAVTSTEWCVTVEDATSHRVAADRVPLLCALRRVMTIHNWCYRWGSWVVGPPRIRVSAVDHEGTSVEVSRDAPWCRIGLNGEAPDIVDEREDPTVRSNAPTEPAFTSMSCYFIGRRLGGWGSTLSSNPLPANLHGVSLRAGAASALSEMEDASIRERCAFLLNRRPFEVDAALDLGASPFAEVAGVRREGTPAEVLGSLCDQLSRVVFDPFVRELGFDRPIPPEKRLSMDGTMAPITKVWRVLDIPGGAVSLMAPTQIPTMAGRYRADVRDDAGRTGHGYATSRLTALVGALRNLQAARWRVDPSLPWLPTEW